MTAVEQQLLETLLELERAIQGGSGPGPKPSLRPLFERLDSLAAQLPRGTDPDLLHFLHRKSYQKARLWLEGRNAENARGTCGAHD